MLIGVPKEIKNHEYRVGMAPASVREAIKHGHQVMVQTNAGEGIGVSDEEYARIGAEIVDTPEEIFARAELVVKVKEPQAGERAMLREGQVLTDEDAAPVLEPGVETRLAVTLRAGGQVAGHAAEHAVLIVDALLERPSLREAGGRVAAVDLEVAGIGGAVLGVGRSTTAGGEQ